MKDVYRLSANDGSAGPKGVATSVSAKSNVDILPGQVVVFGRRIA